jgi:hypothetical protein
MILQEKFQAIAELYVEAFLRKHGFFDEEDGSYSDWEWVSNVGGVVEIADYYIGFDDIRFDIDNSVSKELFFEWYNFCVEKEKTINYRSYTMGLRE